MKITKTYLRQVIQEELRHTLSEMGADEIMAAAIAYNNDLDEYEKEAASASEENPPSEDLQKKVRHVLRLVSERHFLLQPSKDLQRAIDLSNRNFNYLDLRGIDLSSLPKEDFEGTSFVGAKIGPHPAEGTAETKLPAGLEVTQRH
jgi:hypothetical protein